MTYAERADEAQQEQLDWLHEIHQEAQKQTALLARIAQHTALLYGVAMVSVVLFVIGALAWLMSALAS